MAKILVIRFSAIGDVAMTIPVVYSFAAQYPEHRVTVLSRSVLGPLFTGCPENVDFLGVDLKGEYKGAGGLNRLFAELKRQKYDYVIDLNSVLRSLYLSFRFMLEGKSVSVVRKNKLGQWGLTRRLGKSFKRQPTAFQLYRDTFVRLGFSFDFGFTSIFETNAADLSHITSVFGSKGSDKWIGIAPFAKHAGKTYPLELQEQVVAHFARRPDTHVFLFGGGKKESEVFDSWIDKYPSVHSIVGKLGMYQELVLMNTLDVMLSMDSANMHFASLAGVKVVSIWGQTHPYSGFLGWGQTEENTVQIPLSCRPCSSHGTKPCYKGTWECMYGITPDEVIGKIEAILR